MAGVFIFPSLLLPHVSAETSREPCPHAVLHAEGGELPTTDSGPGTVPVGFQNPAHSFISRSFVQLSSDYLLSGCPLFVPS